MKKNLVLAVYFAVLAGYLFWCVGRRFPTPPVRPYPLSEKAIGERIERYRKAAATVVVTTPEGKPLAGVPVVIRQTRHQFLFGGMIYGLDPASDTPEQRAYRERFADLFNYATLRFYWGEYEPVEDHPETERLRRVARWCVEHGITTKGHPLCWHEVRPSWLDGKPPHEVLRLQLERIRREVTTFAGLTDVWDVVNEAVVLPTQPAKSPLPDLARSMGTLPLIHEAFATAHQANPAAILALNDYKTSNEYKDLIGACLKDQVPIDVIGIQAHMHNGYLRARETWRICERFAAFKKPLQITEVTILAGPRKEKLDYTKDYVDWVSTPDGEKQQAAQVKEFYTILFSHPAVQGITWWDFTDRGAWLGAPAGLLRKDMTPRPAYETLQRLIKQKWWTPEVRATTDATGQVQFRGFLGDYVLETAAGQGRFRLDHAGAMKVAARLAP